jgi:hypothetical protein
VREEKMGVLGIQRVIPIHFTILTHSCQVDDDCRQPTNNAPGGGASVCNLVSQTCTAHDGVNVVQSIDPVPYERISMAIARANSIFAPAGIHFYFAGAERITVNDFADLRRSLANVGDIQVSWATIWPKIKLIFPQATSASWPSNESRSKSRWLNLAASRWASRNEIRVFIPIWGHSGSYGFMPFEGRCVIMSPTDMGTRANVSESRYDYAPTFAHELGHYMGLPHTFDDVNLASFVPDPRLLNPWTGSPWVLSDFWDMVYRPGSLVLSTSNQFFSSKSGAAAFESALKSINTGRTDQNPEANFWNAGSNCQGDYDGNGSVRCRVGTNSYNLQSLYHQDSRISGLAFTGSGDNPGGTPPTYHRHVNVMSYMRGFDAELSPSQVRFVQGALRHDLPISNHNLEPVETRWGYRNVLGGQYLNREPSYDVDFDGDGKRDLAVFQMDTNPSGTNYQQGRFRVLLSSNNYNKSQQLTVNFGQLGDVPVLADFNGDNVTDFAVWRTGGPGNLYNTQGNWVWCLSSKVGSNPATHSCASPTQVAFGLRDDVPFPGLSFSSTSSDRWLTVYRPSSGTWYWRKTNSATITTKTLGGAGQIPLPGLYSSDWITDLAVYNPANATFRLLTSESSWNGTPSSIAFSTSWQTDDPATSGLLGQPQRGSYHRRTVSFVTVPRRTFQLFSPIDGSWETVSDPLASPASTKTCYAVNGNSENEIPITGLFDRNGDNLYDFAKARRLPDDKLTVYLIDATSTGCAATPAVTIANLPGRTQVFFVKDMTGDQKNELMLLDPHTMTWTWRTSESGYTLQGGTQQFGDESIDQYMLPL